MHYVISGIHNDDGRFCEMLARIHLYRHIHIIHSEFSRGD